MCYNVMGQAAIESDPRVFTGTIPPRYPLYWVIIVRMHSFHRCTIRALPVQYGHRWSSTSN